MRRSHIVALGLVVGMVALVTSSCATEIKDPREIVLTFDQSATAENEGNASTQVLKTSRNDGDVLSANSEFSERAIRLPIYGPTPDPPLAMIVVTEVLGDALNPLDNDFKFGVDFSLDTTSAGAPWDNGDNLMQRGLFEHPSQFKLEVDAGRPTCRVKGSDGQVVVRSSVPVDRQAWYRVSCERRKDQVTLDLLRLADEMTWIATKKGATGSLDFAADIPLSIGGKVGASGEPTQSADQFNGLIDQAVLDIVR